MTNFDNKLNINNVRQAYTPNFKKDDEVDVKPEVKTEKETSLANEKALEHGEMLGRTMVNKPLSAETLQSVQDSLNFYKQHPAFAGLAVKAGDQAYDLGESYEQACCKSCDAAYAKVSKN